MDEFRKFLESVKPSDFHGTVHWCRRRSSAAAPVLTQAGRH
jgi:hypothetical protein